MGESIGIDLRMYRMSGIGRYLQTLVPELISHLHARHILIFGEPKELGDEAWLNDSRIKLCSFRSPIFSISEQIHGAVRFRGCDLLWTPQFNIPLLYRGSLVVTIHDLCQLAHPDSLGNGVQRWYARQLMSKVAERASAIFCVSEFTRKEILKYLTVDAARIVLTIPGRGLQLSDAPVAPHVQGGNAYFLAVGNVKRHKNLGRLIEAFAKIRTRVSHDLVIVGKQEDMRNSDAALGRSSTLIDGRVRLTGHISDRELQTYYERATALVFPSLYEGFGYPILEAMAQGCPVACSDIASMPEVAGDAALFFDPLNIDSIAEAMTTIACDLNLRTNLIARGRERVKMFDVRVCARKTSETINVVLTDSRRHRGI